MPLSINDHIASAVNGARDVGRPVLLAYVDDDGYPHISNRGSTHVHGADQLAIWARNPEGGFLEALAKRPQVGLFAFNMDPFTMLYFKGRARVDESASDEIWNAIPQGERDLDPDRKGVPVVVDLDAIQGLGPDGFFTMERD